MFEAFSLDPALFAELTVKGEDTCFDADCFNAKREAFVQIAIKQDRSSEQEPPSFRRERWTYTSRASSRRLNL